MTPEGIQESTLKAGNSFFDFEGWQIKGIKGWGV